MTGPLARRFCRSLLLLAIGLLLGQPAGAHPLGMSLTEIEIGPASSTMLISMAAEDLERALDRSFYDPAAGVVPATVLPAILPLLQDYIARHVRLQAGSATCPATPFTITTNGHVVQARSVWSCGEAAGDLEIHSDLLAGIEPRFVQIVRVTQGQDAREIVLQGGRSTAPILQPNDRLAVALDFVLAGIEHISIGADHIAFLAGLILWARSFWPVFKVVTAFTAAHAITLSLAVLDVVHVAGRIVEPLIAITVIWAAVENFLSRDVERRWRLTFFLGLIHGLGFATILQEYGLPRGSVGLALASFNIGIELGQIAIVLLILPCLLALDRLWPGRGTSPGRSPILVYALATPLALLGLWWLVQRLML